MSSWPGPNNQRCYKWLQVTEQDINKKVKRKTTISTVTLASHTHTARILRWSKLSRCVEQTAIISAFTPVPHQASTHRGLKSNWCTSHDLRLVLTIISMSDVKSHPSYAQLVHSAPDPSIHPSVHSAVALIILHSFDLFCFSIDVIRSFIAIANKLFGAVVLLLIQLFNVFIRSSCCQEESVVFISPNNMNDCIIAGAERIFILLYCTIEKVEIISNTSP